MDISVGTGCMLLDSIPAELRNEICKLAFSPDHNLDEDLDLAAACPPSKSLLLTCKQVKSEAHGLFKTAYRQYWHSTKFTVDFRKGPQDIDIDFFNTSDLDGIRNLNVYQNPGQAICGGRVIEVRCTLLDPKGLWLMVGKRATGKSCSIYMVPTALEVAPGKASLRDLLKSFTREEGVAACVMVDGYYTLHIYQSCCEGGSES